MTPSDSLAQATQQLRERSFAHAAEIAETTLRTALRAQRHSLPVRAAPPHDYLRISELVLVAVLRARIDTSTPEAAVGRVHLAVNRDQSLTAVTIEMIVQQGHVLIDVANRVHTAAEAALHELLGAPREAMGEATINVHIGDVTSGNPHLS